MGYDLHVTRKAYWADEEGPIISMDEWTAYVAADKDLAPDPENPGRDNAIFVAHPQRWPIWWNAPGEIIAKNPDPTVVAKLVQIANALKGRVLGDDDEIYGIDLSDPTKCQRR